MADAEYESAGAPEAGDWRTSPTTGDLEFYDGRAWVARVGPWPLIRDSDPLVGPPASADQAAGAEDAAGSGADSG